MATDSRRVVLVVEDDPIIAFDIETILRELSCETVLVFGDNHGALQWLNCGTPDLAILDFKLTRGTSLDTATLLAERRVPIAFVTGYGSHVPLPATLAECPVFNKPVVKTDLAEWLVRIGPAIEAPQECRRR